MLKSLFYAKRAFSAFIAASVLVCIFSVTPAYAEDARTAVGIMCDVDGKTGVTNIGDNTDGLITISFDREMDTTTLKKNNIVLTKDDGTAVNYDINVVDNKTVTIDKSCLSNLSADNSADALGTELAAQKFKITVKGVSASGSSTVEPETGFSFSTDEIVAPVPYVSGKVIRDVSVGLIAQARYGFKNENVKNSSGTDRNTDTFIWANDNVSSNGLNDWTVKYNLGKEYDICGIVLRNYNGGDPYRQIEVGGSESDTLEKITDSGYERYLTTNGNFTDAGNRNKVFNAFFNPGEKKAARYIYIAHPRIRSDGLPADRHTIFSEIYVFAYEDSKSCVAWTSPKNGEKNVTNIGIHSNGYIEIGFKEKMNTATLNDDSIILRDSLGNKIKYEPTVNDGKIYKIDKKYLSKLYLDNSNQAQGTKIGEEDYTVTVTTNVRSENAENDNINNTAYSFSFKTAEIVAPVDYVDGKAIKDVLEGVEAVTKYGLSEGALAIGGTDRNKGTCIRVKNSSSTEKDNLIAKYDLKNNYDLAGVAIRNFSGYAPFREIAVGGSLNPDVDKTTNSEFNQYIKTHSLFSQNDDRDRIFNIFFNQGQKIARYIYVAHPRSDASETIYSEIYVFAYVDYDINSFGLVTDDGARHPYAVRSGYKGYAKVNVSKFGKTDDYATIYFAEYSPAGNLANISVNKVDISQMNEGEEREFMFPLTYTENGGMVKAFIMKDDTVIPLERASVYRQNEFFPDAREIMNEDTQYLLAAAVQDENGNYYEDCSTHDDKYDIDAIFYDSVVGDQTKVFAYIGIPKGATADNPVPAVVCVHGGAGMAFDEWVKLWNDKGFAAIAMTMTGDGPIKGITPGTANQYIGKKQHPYAGTGAFCWGDQAFDKDVKNASMYRNVLNVIRAHNVLRNYPGVDKNKIGITGISWGGVTTTTTIGVDNRFIWAAPVYGTGYLDESETYFKNQFKYKDNYSVEWDPANFAARSEVPTLYINSDSDVHFSITATSKTCGVTKNGQMSVRHNFGHGYSQGWSPSEIYTFANAMSNGENNPFISVSNTVAEGGVLNAELKYPDGITISRIKTYYITTDEHPYNDGTTDIGWKEISDYSVTDKGISVVLPEAATYCYATIEDSNGNLISTRYVKIR